MKAYWGSGRIAPRILDLGTIWKWVVNHEVLEHSKDVMFEEHIAIFNA
jgi:hypothetical protein